ncbi:hypothetical protein [Streptomyces varsoviensis]|uniref:Uncharacterized protein n=1 Tax=Streptomyces varsoviensis TaxID=67373 RepID=A0ABR5ISC8_9ACTN|nr:hypothetical protein [Streptomyces varsoviensis]KOG52005.1 hypothetical protein ADK38_44420 [Streptomyces varsoviensis]
MKSAARAELARMIAERGVNGALLVFTDPPEELGVRHQAEAGAPDTAVRLGAEDVSDGTGEGASWGA